MNQTFYQRFGIAANLNQSYSRYDTINPDKISRTATYRNQFIVNKYIFNYQGTKRLSNVHTLKAGFIFTQLQMNLLDSNFIRHKTSGTTKPNLKMMPNFCKDGWPGNIVRMKRFK
ncbi:MAG: hypothetical protein IPN26_10795 [Bacteroidetes bacterium]|nr:hypothetical protein [Bacteroidota bacterium]